MKNCFFKRFFTYTLCALSLFNSSNLNIYGATNYTPETENVSTSQKIKNFVSNHKLAVFLPVTAVTSTALGAVLGTASIIGANVATAKYGKELKAKILTKFYQRVGEDYKRNFSNYTQSKYTKKQEGLCWCWAACIEGLYRYHGIENISQKDIVSAAFNLNKFQISNSWIKRDQGLPAATSNMTSLVKILCQIDRSLVGSIGVFSIQGINRRKSGLCNSDHAISDLQTLKEALLHYYNSIGKSAFMINDADALDINKSGHSVNVISIDEDNITIEEPGTGIRYTKKTDEYLTTYLISANCATITEIRVLGFVKNTGYIPSIKFYYQRLNNSSEGNARPNFIIM